MSIEALLQSLGREVRPYFRRLESSPEDWAPGIPEHLWEEQRQVLRQLAEISKVPPGPGYAPYELARVYGAYVVEWFRVQQCGEIDKEFFRAQGYDPSPYADRWLETPLQETHATCYIAWHWVFGPELSEAARSSCVPQLPAFGFLVGELEDPT